jgi:hypothetical protein
MKEEKNIISDHAILDITGGVSFDDFVTRYKELTSKIVDDFEVVSDFKIDCESGYYNDTEDYYERIVIYYNRYETNEETELRKDQVRWHEERRMSYLKRLIDDNKEEAVKYLKELNLI